MLILVLAKLLSSESICNCISYIIYNDVKKDSSLLSTSYCNHKEEKKNHFYQFIIYYDKNLFCISDRMSSKTIYEEMRRRNSFSVYLMGLRPSTPYIVIISAITRYGKGLRTYPLLKTTLEQ